MTSDDAGGPQPQAAGSGRVLRPSTESIDLQQDRIPAGLNVLPGLAFEALFVRLGRELAGPVAA